MPLRTVVDPGGEIYLSFAKNKLKQWKEQAARAGLRSFGKVVIADEATIYVSSLFLGHGVWKDVIRVVVSSPGGFVLRPVMSYAAGGSIVSAVTGVQPYTGGVITVVDYDLVSAFVQVVEGEPRSSGRATTSGVYGYFSAARFTAFGDDVYMLGAFRHEYGESQSVVLGFRGDYQLVDTSTGVALAGLDYEGDIDLALRSYSVSAAGRVAYLEVAANYYINYTRLDISFDSGVQALATAIPDGIGENEALERYYGEGTESYHLVVDNIGGPDGSTRSLDTVRAEDEAVFHVVKGVDAGGAEVQITVTTSRITSSSYYGVSIGDGIDTFNAAVTTADAGSAVLALPNGNSKTFVLADSAITYSGDGELSSTSTHTGSYSKQETTGVLRALYADPAIPVVVYVYTTGNEVTSSPFVSSSVTDIVSVSFTLTRTTTREIGMLIGSEQIVLRSETVADAPVLSGAGVASYNGNIEASGEIDTVTPFYQVDNAYKIIPRTNYDDGDLMVSFSATSATDWLLSVGSLADLSGAAENYWEMFGGQISAATAKQNVAAFIVSRIRGFRGAVQASYDALEAHNPGSGASLLPQLAAYDAILADLAPPGGGEPNLAPYAINPDITSVI